MFKLADLGTKFNGFVDNHPFFIAEACCLILSILFVDLAGMIWPQYTVSQQYTMNVDYLLFSLVTGIGLIFTFAFFIIVGAWLHAKSIQKNEET